MSRFFQGLRQPAAIILCLLLTVPGTARSQESEGPATLSSAQSETWSPPEITELPSGWWQQFQFSNPEVFQNRASLFLSHAAEAINNLEGENLASAQNTLRTLRNQVDLIKVAVQTPATTSFENILSSDEYTLEELLTLQSQWRELRERQQIPRLRVDQLQQEAVLAQQKQAPLLRQYEDADISSPGRVLLGLSRVAARIEYEFAGIQQRRLEQSLLGMQNQSELILQQLDFARANLVRGDARIDDVENDASQARTEVENQSERIAAIQLQLRNILSGGDSKPSLELLRKQQLTRALADRTLAIMQAALHDARTSWYRFRSDILPLNFDLNQAQSTTRAMISDTQKQVAVWTVASETTLVTPVRSNELNTIKNFDLAHAAARDTLSLIEQIHATNDDLLTVQEVLSEQMVREQSGLGGSWTRLKLVGSSFSEKVFHFVDFELFKVGDRAVTMGGIFLMFVILAFGFALSWFLRHMLERLGKKSGRYARSPAIYTLGRLLHYIIIVAALFAALASLGLDFTNFALIAGALSVGIGFGLQSIVNNLVSGLILLFEGSLRVGDYIELDSGIAGVVKEINTRATVINTNDSVDIVVPNSDFVNNQLTNWTLRESIARMRLGFGVAYGTDKELVRKASLEAAALTEFVLLNMPGREPELRLVNFGDSSLDFQMLVWVSRSGVRRPQKVNANFLWNLETKLGEYGIEIPFPQRDIRIIEPATNAPSTDPEPASD